MVIHLCIKELSKPGYKTCLISCRKIQQDGKQVSRFQEGMENLISDFLAILTNGTLFNTA